MASFLRDTPTKIKCVVLVQSTASVQMTDIDCQMAFFQAPAINTGTVYLGGSDGAAVPTVAAADPGGIALAASDITPWIPCSNLSEFSYLTSSTGSSIAAFLVL